ncbi:MAG: PaaI family thioesterase [Novosphingobium sp.]|nr:PaaI family thioesterase [Novosphingobium sp.]
MIGDPPTAFDLSPYAQSLGVLIERAEGGLPLMACDPGAAVLGRPGFWHGGVIGGLLEIAAYGAVCTALGIPAERLRPVTITVQFLRAAPLVRTRALGTIERAGKRLVNVTACAWQEDRNRHVATAQLTLQRFD